MHLQHGFLYTKKKKSNYKSKTLNLSNKSRIIRDNKYKKEVI
jgi:hypothetical protein